jgi:uncharacterized protein (TIGR03437 family)
LYWRIAAGIVTNIKLIRLSALWTAVVVSPAGLSRIAAVPTLPVTFEENTGQVAEDVLFLARAAGYRVYLTSRGAVISADGGRVAYIALAGASRGLNPRGINRLPGRSNYLVGSDPARWRTGIANYEKVRYSRAYPGIDMIWYGNRGEVEYDFAVAPGADPRRIRLKTGVAALRLEADGGLTAGGIRFQKPRALQDGREVACRYRIRGRSVTFVLGEYDRARPLTIDPVLSYSTFLGGTSSGPVSSSVAVATDREGNVFVAAVTRATNLPVTPGAFQNVRDAQPCYTYGDNGPTVPAPCGDVFVAKLNKDGSAYLFCTYLGSDTGESVTAMAVDPSGNVWLAGSFKVPSVNPLGLGFGGYNSSLLKLSADGSQLLFSDNIPAQIAGIALDAAGAVYLTGEVSGNSLPAVNAFQSTISSVEALRSSDHGATWQDWEIHQPGAWRLTFDPTDPQTLYILSSPIGAGISVYKTTDSGAHWTEVLKPSSPSCGPSCILSTFWENIVLAPSAPSTVYVSGDFQVAKTTDGGDHWTILPSPEADLSIIAVDPKDANTVYAWEDYAILRSTDGAVTWAPTGPTNPGANSIVIDPVNTATIYAETGNDILKSSDGGATWKAFNLDPVFHSINYIAMDPLAPQTLYAWGDTGEASNLFFKTTDGGDHWTLLPFPGWFKDVFADTAAANTVWGIRDIWLWVSRDGGLTWQQTGGEIPQVGGDLSFDWAGGMYITNTDSTKSDAFVMKLDASGTRIAYSTYLGGWGDDFATAIAVDSLGRAYVTGQTKSFNFPVTASAFKPRTDRDTDSFVSVLDPTGSRLEWSTFFGTGLEQPTAIALSPDGGVHIAGDVNYFDWYVSNDSFSAKLASDGSGLIYDTPLSGTQLTLSGAVATDPAGNAYVAGSSSGLGLATPIQGLPLETSGGFVASMDGKTGVLTSAAFLGSGLVPQGFAVQPDGTVYVAGNAASSSLPLQNPLQSAPGPAFLLKISPQFVDDSSIYLAGAVNAASYAAALAPGSIVSIFGASMAQSSAANTGVPLPLFLADVRVTVGGLAAPLYYVSPSQINAQIPFEIPPGPAEIQVVSTNGVAKQAVQVAATAPGIFTLNAEGTGPGAILHGATYRLVTAAEPAAPGEIVSIYCTGLGAVGPAGTTGAVPPSPPPQAVSVPQVWIAGVARVTYAGLAPGFAGLYQVNAEVPPGTAAGLQSLIIASGGASSNAVAISIR